MLQKQTQKNIMAWIIVLSSALFFFYFFIQMNCLNSIGSELVQELRFTNYQISKLFSYLSFGNLIFIIPAGILLDILSVRTILLFTFALVIMASYVFTYVSNFTLMIILRFVIGLCGSFCFLSSIKLASFWIKSHHMALITGLIVTIAMLGGIVAQIPLVILIQTFGWRIAMRLIGLLGILFYLVQVLYIHDESNNVNSVVVKKTCINNSFKSVFKNTQNWLGGIYICFINVPFFVFGGVFGKAYLTQVHAFDQHSAATIISMLFLGMIIGSPLCGWISDKISLRKLPMIIGSILSIIILLIITSNIMFSIIVEMILYCMLGLALSCQIIGYPLINENNKKEYAATATSIASILVMSGGLLLPLYAWLLENNIIIVKGKFLICSSNNYIQANYLLLLGLFLALFASFFVKETYCHSFYDD